MAVHPVPIVRSQYLSPERALFKQRELHFSFKELQIKLTCTYVSVFYKPEASATFRQVLPPVE